MVRARGGGREVLNSSTVTEGKFRESDFYRKNARLIKDEMDQGAFMGKGGSHFVYIEVKGDGFYKITDDNNGRIVAAKVLKTDERGQPTIFGDTEVIKTYDPNQYVF